MPFSQNRPPIYIGKNELEAFLAIHDLNSLFKFFSSRVNLILLPNYINTKIKLNQ